MNALPPCGEHTERCDPRGLSHFPKNVAARGNDTIWFAFLFQFLDMFDTLDLFQRCEHDSRVQRHGPQIVSPNKIPKRVRNIL